MAEQLEDLVIRLSVEMGDLKRGMKEASKEVKKSTQTVSSSIKTMAASFLKWSAAIALLRGAYREFLATVNRVDALQHLADNLGITAKSLAALQLAAKLSGNSIEQVTIAMTTLQRNVGLAAIGTGEAGRALEILKLEAQEISKLPLDQQFTIIADKISKLEDATQQAAVASRIFGESGGRMLKLLRGGSDLINKAAKDTEAFGTAISKLDAKKIQDVKDATTRLGEAWDGVITSLSTENAEAIAQGINLIADSMRTVAKYAVISAASISNPVKALQMWKEQMDSDRLREYIKNVEALDAALDKVAGDGEVPDIGFDDLMDKIDKAGMAQLELNAKMRTALGERLSAEEEAIEASYTHRLAIIQELEETGKLSAEEASQAMIDARLDKEAELDNALREQRDARLQEEMAALQASLDAELAASEERERILQEFHEMELARIEKEKQMKIAAMNATASALGSIADLMEATSKEQFETIKALRIAEAIINTAAAVTNIWAEHAGNPYLAAALTVAAVANGALQIAKIQSTTYKGGGSAGGLSTSSAATGSGGQAPTQDVNVTLVGDNFSGEGVRDLIDRIDAERGDGYNTNYNVTLEN